MADAAVLTATRSLGDYYEEVAKAAGDAKAAANWVMREVLKMANVEKRDLRRFSDDPPVAATRLAQIINLVKSGALSGSAAKQVFAEVRHQDADPREVAARLNLLQVGDANQLERWLDEIIAEHPEEARRFLGGETKLQGVLVGLIMKRSEGRADPKKLNQLLAARRGE